jgi:hypothetical protein
MLLISLISMRNLLIVNNLHISYRTLYLFLALKKRQPLRLPFSISTFISKSSCFDKNRVILFTLLNKLHATPEITNIEQTIYANTQRFTSILQSHHTPRVDAHGTQATQTLAVFGRFIFDTFGHYFSSNLYQNIGYHFGIDGASRYLYFIHFQ